MTTSTDEDFYVAFILGAGIGFSIGSAALICIAEGTNPLTYLKKLCGPLPPQLTTVVVKKSHGLGLSPKPNHLYDAVETYLSTNLSPSVQRIEAHKLQEDEPLSISIDENQDQDDIADSFLHGDVKVELKWASGSKIGVKYFELVFPNKHKETVLNSYLPYVVKRAKEIKRERKTVRLHTVDYNARGYWSSVVLTHQATFETLAMEGPETKEEIMEDLDRFSRSVGRVGKPWKREYLIYGPRGAGKSSLVAAMANHLKFDVYDLDLRAVKCNSDLRKLLIGVGNRSVLVIENTDCVVGLQNCEAESEGKKMAKDDKVTLSGLLGFIDGLRSSCGDRRIIVFTTSHKDRLDPALLRPGRMDLHIHMSYCTFYGFKTLALNHLKTQGDPLFDDMIKDLLAKVEVTPAEIAGQLMKNGKARASLLIDVIRYLRKKEEECKSKSKPSSFMDIRECSEGGKGAV